MRVGALEGSGVAVGVPVACGVAPGSAVLDRKAAGMLAGKFAPGFRVDLHHKDLGIVLDTARETGMVIRLGAVVAQLLAAVRAHGDLDHTALLGGVEWLSGRET